MLVFFSPILFLRSLFGPAILCIAEKGAGFLALPRRGKAARAFLREKIEKGVVGQ
jgi:hypothetical protein